MAILAATLVLGVVSYSTLRNDMSPGSVVAFLLRPVACWGLVYLLVRDGVAKTSATPQYWTNLVSTFISLVLFVAVPVFASQLALLNAVGISPGDWLLTLLWRQVAFCVYFILPIFALTLATRDALQMGIAMAVLGVGWMGASSKLGSHHSDLEGRDWLVCGFVIFVGAATVALIRGFTIRRYAVWPVICIAEALCWLVFNTQPWRYSAPREWITNERIDTATIQIEFDRTRAGTKPNERPPGNPIEVVIPVRLNAIRKDLKVIEYRSSFTVEGKSGFWHSGWLDSNAFTRLGEPDSWFVLGIDPKFYRHNYRSPVRLNVDSAFTVTRRIKPPVKVSGNSANIGGFGQCRYSRTTTGAYQTACVSPLYKAVLYDDTLILSCAAVPFKPSFDPLYATNQDWKWTEPHLDRMSFDASVALIRRQFEVNEIKLGDYELDVPKTSNKGEGFIVF